MTARVFCYYWCMMGLSAQTSQWEKAMTTNLIEMGQALQRSSGLEVDASDHDAMAANAIEESIAKKAKATKLEEEAAVLIEESEANANVAAQDELQVEELEEEIVVLEAEAAAHAAAATSDAVLAEEESAQAVADSAQAARLESQARGEEIGIAFCEFIRILDVACDVVGGVTAVGLESGAVAEALKAVGEASVAGATEVEEEREVALVAEANDSALAEEAVEDGVQMDAAEKSELSEEQRHEAEEKQAEADELIEESEADEAAAEEQEVTATEDRTVASVQASVALEKGVAASWNAMLAAGCGILSLAFFFVRILVNVIVPGAKQIFLGTFCKRDSYPVSGLSRDISYILHHCAIFLIVALSFQPLLRGLDGMSLRARGGILLAFACAAAMVQSVALHVIPSGVAQTESIFQLISHLCRRMLVLPFSFTIEILTVWVVFGARIFKYSDFSSLLLCLLWVSLTISLSVHVMMLEIPRLRSGLGVRTMNDSELYDSLSRDEEFPFATENDSLLVSKSASSLSDSTSASSWLSLFWQDLCALQVPSEILILACLTGIVFHSMGSLIVVWPVARPVLLSSRPKWLVTVGVALGSFLIFVCALTLCCDNNSNTVNCQTSTRKRSVHRGNMMSQTKSRWYCFVLCYSFFHPCTFVKSFQSHHGLPSAYLYKSNIARVISSIDTMERLHHKYHARRSRVRSQIVMDTTSTSAFGENLDKNVTTSFGLDEVEHDNATNTNFDWTSQNIELAIPALIGMLADPLLSLMDTAYVGRVGPTELAALGACTSIFHLAFNAFRATTAATTSLVGNAQSVDERKQVTQLSLTLGVVLGFVVMILLKMYGPWCLSTMGVPRGSSLYPHAIAYLGTRLWAAPAVLAIVVAEGAFRGYGDTKISLIASLVAASINLILDPILMFPLGWGVKGAAAATALCQFGAAMVYFYFLMKRNMLPKRSAKSVVNKSKVISTILGANLAMITKQGSLLLAWAYATARATRIGSAHVAAHQVALSCWLVSALMLDGAAVSAQVLMSRCIGQYRRLKSLVSYMLRFSVLQGLVTTGLLLLASPYLPKMFTRDRAIQGHLVSLMPLLAWQQLLVSLTLVTESLAIGGNQFQLLAFGTSISTVLAVRQLQQASTVIEIWSTGIVSLFVGRLVTALIGVANVMRANRHNDSKLGTDSSD